MKYKIYEKLTDYFRLRFFSKTNIAIVAVMSILLNIVLAGVALSLHKNFETFLSLYAPVKSEGISVTVPADEVTTALQTSHKTEESKEITTAEPLLTEPSSEKSSEIAVTEESDNKEANTSAAESEESQQGTYYVTNSGKKYHKSTCGYLSKSRISISLSDAKARGYSPCSRCIK